jgi:hypothetical protein
MNRNGSKDSLDKKSLQKSQSPQKILNNSIDNND